MDDGTDDLSMVYSFKSILACYRVIHYRALKGTLAYAGGHACGRTWTEHRRSELTNDNCGQNLIDRAAALTITVTIAN